MQNVKLTKAAITDAVYSGNQSLDWKLYKNGIAHTLRALKTKKAKIYYFCWLFGKNSKLYIRPTKVTPGQANPNKMTQKVDLI
jgi:hypothetical protein